MFPGGREGVHWEQMGQFDENNIIDLHFLQTICKNNIAKDIPFLNYL